MSLRKLKEYKCKSVTSQDKTSTCDHIPEVPALDETSVKLVELLWQFLFSANPEALAMLCSEPESEEHSATFEVF